jgi:hypothetical protein
MTAVEAVPAVAAVREAAKPAVWVAVGAGARLCLDVAGEQA